jgi:hypothetical protein
MMLMMMVVVVAVVVVVDVMIVMVFVSPHFLGNHLQNQMRKEMPYHQRQHNP